jgi:hypothetical protein
MIRIGLVAAALLLGCGGGKGGGGGNAQLRQACEKVCDCFAETSSSSGGFSSSSGAGCVDECVGEATSGTSSSSGFSGGGGPSQACLSCINGATCDALVNNNACSTECEF